MKRYEVDYGPLPEGHKDAAFSTIEEAIEYADRCASYTGYDIKILDRTDDTYVFMRKWWKSKDGIELNEDPIDFGDEGYYGDWQDEAYI